MKEGRMYAPQCTIFNRPRWFLWNKRASYNQLVYQIGRLSNSVASHKLEMDGISVFCYKCLHGKFILWFICITVLKIFFYFAWIFLHLLIGKRPDLIYFCERYCSCLYAHLTKRIFNLFHLSYALNKKSRSNDRAFLFYYLLTLILIVFNRNGASNILHALALLKLLLYHNNCFSKLIKNHNHK